MSKHVTVLLNEAIEHLNIKQDGIYVDATLGGGGHSEELLKRIKTGKLYCFDQDQYAIDRAQAKLSKIGGNFEIIKSNFSNLKNELSKRKIDKIDGILYDLGVSSFQFDIPERGFSYRYEAKLDMRMNQDAELSAWEIVNNYSYHELVNILYKYSDEKYAKSIARNIEKYRENKTIDSTFELVDIIKASMPMKELSKKGHPAKKTFQALRIAVNEELYVFEKSLNEAIEILNPEGRVVVISFHSAEDRICKHILKKNSFIDIPKGVPFVNEDTPVLKLITRKPILAGEKELSYNNRAHSAKMRVAEKN